VCVAAVSPLFFVVLFSGLWEVRNQGFLFFFIGDFWGFRGFAFL